MTTIMTTTPRQHVLTYTYTSWWRGHGRCRGTVVRHSLKRFLKQNLLTENL